MWDELTGVWIRGLELLKAYHKMQPHYDIHSTREPGTFSNSMEFQKPLHLNIYRALETEEFLPEFENKE